MYRFDYDSGSGAVSPMVFDARVYTVAEKYGVTALLQYAKKKFENTVQACWNMDDFSRVIAEVYTGNSAPFDLREVLANVSSQHIGELLQKDDFQQVLADATGFAADVVQLLAPDTVKYSCPCCDNQWEGPAEAGSYYCMFCGSYRSDWRSYLIKQG
jgi:hypothetical protein